MIKITLCREKLCTMNLDHVNLLRFQPVTGTWADNGKPSRRAGIPTYLPTAYRWLRSQKLVDLWACGYYMAEGCCSVRVGLWGIVDWSTSLPLSS